jgi:hypothetical protein
MIRKLLSKYEVDPHFLEVVFSFGEEPHLAEASSNYLAIHSTTPERTGMSVRDNLRRTWLIQ